MKTHLNFPVTLTHPTLSRLDLGEWIGNHQLMVLFLSSLTVLFVGMGLFPLLPLYAAEFGADNGLIGLFMALVYVANAAGPIFAGWAAGRVDRRKLFIFASLVGIPGLLLLGFANTFWQVIVLAGLVWFSGGLILALVSIFTGLVSSGAKRGKSFSLMALAAPLGSLTGGLVIGQLVSRSGYPLMFGVLALVWLILPLIGWLALREPQATPAPKTSIRAAQKVTAGGDPRLGMLLAANLLASTAIAVTRLSTPLAMRGLDFTAAQVASTATISGLVAIPVTLWIGSLSDRFGRHKLLVMANLMAAAGALVLVMATDLWQFWVVASLTLLAFGSTNAMSAAYATDMLPKERLNKALSSINAGRSIAGIVSFAGAGYLLSVLGMPTLFIATAAFPLAGIGLLELLRQSAPSRSKAPFVNCQELGAEQAQPCL
jgi:YNFM family putative membrane transporter